MFKRLLFCLVLLCLVFADFAVAGQVNTFIYHRFDEQRYPSTNISSDIFKQQLEYLKENQINVISLGDIAQTLASGDSLPEHAVALCADDSYRSFYDVAMPLLRQYGYPVTLFVNTDAVGKKGYLGWDELKQLQKEGVEIENHTASHAYLVEADADESFPAWRERIKQDIIKAQNAFELNMGTRPTLFAYTFGEYSDEVVELTKEIGFLAAYAQQSGVIHDQHSRYNLPRFPMGGPFATFDGFVSKLKMKPLIVLEQAPTSSVVRENPPTLSLKLEDAQLNVKRINCFVQGENRCWVEKDDDKGEGWYKVLAENSLTGRRNKYTLTVQGKDGRWSWFSHPWINADNPAVFAPQ